MMGVVCGPVVRAGNDPQAITDPVLLVEVLSETTEAYDRGEKFAHYRRIPSLRDYVLVSQGTARIEIFHRRDEGPWILAEASAGEQIAVPSLGGTIAVDDVYREVGPQGG